MRHDWEVPPAPPLPGASFPPSVRTSSHLVEWAEPKPDVRGPPKPGRNRKAILFFAPHALQVGACVTLTRVSSALRPSVRRPPVNRLGVEQLAQHVLQRDGVVSVDGGGERRA